MTEPYTVIGDSQSRHEWLAMRNSGIGASEIAGVMGENRYQSALELYARKTGYIQDTDDDSPSEAAYWGLRLERIVADEFTRRTGMPHEWSGLLLRSTRYPWAIATLDARVTNAPLECKTASVFLAKEWAQGAPMQYRIQAHQQMLVTDSAISRIACLIGGQRFVWDFVERDETLIKRIIRAGEEFWERVQAKRPPPPDGTDSSFDALNAMHPEQDGLVDLSGEDDALDKERQQVCEDIKKLEKRKKQINALLQAHLGSAATGMTPGGVTYSIREYTRAAYTTAEAKVRQLIRKAPRGE